MFRLNKKLTIGLVTFTLLAIGTTAGLILWQNSRSGDGKSTDWQVSNNKTQTVKGKVVPDESELVVKRGDLYATNPLNITYKDGARNSSDVPFRYAQISGLKNENIQNHVNSQIKAAFEQVNNGEFAKGANQKYVNCDVTANFANILSVSCLRLDGHNYKDRSGAAMYDEIAQQRVNLNYRLDTGDAIKFSDVFIAGANINQVVTTAFYYTWVRNNSTCSDGTDFCLSFRPEYPADIEDRALMTVYAFNHQKDTDFYITESSIIFVINGEKLTLRFSDSASQVALYERFTAANDLYTGEFNSETGFVFEPAYRTALGEMGDNLFVDCVNYVSDKPYSEQSKLLIDQKISETKGKIAKNSNRAMLLTCYATYSTNVGNGSYSSFRGGNLTEVLFRSDSFTMAKEYYQQTGLAKIIDANYASHGDVGPHSEAAMWNSDRTKLNDGVTQESEVREYFLINGKWLELTDEYHAWQREDCAARGGTFYEDGSYCNTYY